jgi:hypothetical protein
MKPGVIRGFMARMFLSFPSSSVTAIKLSIVIIQYSKSKTALAVLQATAEAVALQFFKQLSLNLMAVKPQSGDDTTHPTLVWAITQENLQAAAR